jgi:excisionase family DNA binding protein
MAETETSDKLWTVKDIAAYLAVSPSWVYQHVEAGKLPCIRLGALLRFEPEAIRAWTRGSSAARAVATKRSA